MGRDGRKYVGLHRKDGTSTVRTPGDWSPDPAHWAALHAPHPMVQLWQWDAPWARRWIERTALTIIVIVVACLIVALAKG